MAARILELEAELMKHKRVLEVATKEETDESKIKSQMASKSIDTSDDANDHDAKEENRQVLEDLTIEDLTIEKQDKVGEENKYVCASIETLTKVKDGTSYRLSIGTKDNVVGAGTIFDYDMDGDNVKVSVDMVTDGNCFVPVPTREGRTMLSQEVGSQLLWPRHLVIPLDEKSLYKVTEENGTLGSYKFADAGSVSVGISKEDRAQILNARLLGTDHRQILMFPYNLGAFDISNKKKPVWRIIKCSKQGGIVVCGYYVMRFMRDIILSSNRTIIEVVTARDTPPSRSASFFFFFLHRPTSPPALLFFFLLFAHVSTSTLVSDLLSVTSSVVRHRPHERSLLHLTGRTSPTESHPTAAISDRLLLGSACTASHRPSLPRLYSVGRPIAFSATAAVCFAVGCHLSLPSSTSGHGESSVRIVFDEFPNVATSDSSLNIGIRFGLTFHPLKVDPLSVDSIEGHNRVSGKGFPTTGPRIEAGNVVRVQRGADRREAGRMREGQIDASGFLYASADVFC
ncbi:uncharacterized protein E6C27_scaffold616G00290 [Cucumis melo var. makuwa]|uniref:Uncharacterized protein n=1 Tax=Cucumis melo var. makuwa TaxID=1194695 RepID=A0A5A7V716_CUCMM|nr:uncharacterized protein E6C27_scaffold616G00290 [Cucumis melo var. makuwa]